MATKAERAQAAQALTASGQPFELKERVVAGRRCRVFEHAPTSLRALYDAAVSDRPFLVHEDERLSYAEAAAIVGRVAYALQHRFGVAPGDRVAIAMRNYPEWMLAFMAVTRIGAVAVGMTAHWQGTELAYGLTDSGAKVAFVDAERLARLMAPTVRERVGDVSFIAVRTPDLAPDVHPFESLVDAAGDVSVAEAEASLPTVEPDDPALILYTSGSTGHPKGVLSSHRQVLSGLMSWELDAAIEDRLAGVTAPRALGAGALLAAPLFHVAGLHGTFLASFRAQRFLVCMRRWDPAHAAELIARERLSAVPVPAAMSGDLVRIAREGRHDLSSLQSVGGGGAPRAPEQVRQIASSFGAALPFTGWGMTETNAIGAGIGGADYLGHPGSAGHPSQVLELRVVDEHGHTLPAGQRGELLVRGTSMFTAYWGRPDATAQSFVDGDWFRTGDVAHFDDDGRLYIVDRIKDLIIRGGENIGCGQVESALLMHPDVFEAAAYAVPDERLGEEVGATVCARSGLDAEALREFVAQHLARFEVPRFITVTASPLPRTPSGKILKREIRSQAVAALQAVVLGAAVPNA